MRETDTPCRLPFSGCEPCIFAGFLFPVRRIAYGWNHIFRGNHERLSETACTGRRFVVLACLLLLAGCGRTVFVSGGGYPSSQPGHAVSGQPLSEQADAAWRAGNYAEAERLYNVVARDAALPTEQRALAWERVARAALSSGNMQGAQNALKILEGSGPRSGKQLRVA